jgi:hypothetical protein
MDAAEFLTWSRPLLDRASSAGRRAVEAAVRLTAPAAMKGRHHLESSLESAGPRRFLKVVHLVNLDGERATLGGALGGAIAGCLVNAGLGETEREKLSLEALSRGPDAHAGAGLDIDLESGKASKGSLYWTPDGGEAALEAAARWGFPRSGLLAPELGRAEILAVDFGSRGERRLKIYRPPRPGETRPRPAARHERLGRRLEAAGCPVAFWRRRVGARGRLGAAQPYWSIGTLRAADLAALAPRRRSIPEVFALLEGRSLNLLAAKGAGWEVYFR